MFTKENYYGIQTWKITLEAYLGRKDYSQLIKPIVFNISGTHFIKSY